MLVDAVVIKGLLLLESLQGDEFRPVTWARAILASLVGNAASYFIGAIVRQEPWYGH